MMRALNLIASTIAAHLVLRMFGTHSSSIPPDFSLDSLLAFTIILLFKRTKACRPHLLVAPGKLLQLLLTHRLLFKFVQIFSKLFKRSARGFLAIFKKDFLRLG